MNISNTTYIYLAILFIISLLLPVVTFIIFKIRYKINFRPMIIGAAIWFVMTQILEKALHYIMFTKTPITTYPPFAYALYGSMAAGIFEEIGRYIAFTRLLQDKKQWKDGIAYGIGHGGIESVFIGVLVAVQMWIFSTMIQNGSFLQLKTQLPAGVMQSIYQTLTGNPVLFLISAYERLLAFIIQIALSILVLYAVKKKRWWYVLLAVALHAAVDFVPALYQAKAVDLVNALGTVSIFALAGLIFIIKSGKLFTEK